MFFDVPAIIPIPVNGDSDVAKLPQCALADEVLTIGFSQVKPEFDVSFYEMSGIPFSVRWSHFKAVRDPEREGSLEVKAGVHPKDKSILIHNISSVGRFHFTTRNDLRKVYVSQLSDCMLDWCSLAEKADEVHCIDSSFIHLAQTLNIKRGFFHRVRPTETHFVLRDGWETVEYQLPGSHFGVRSVWGRDIETTKIALCPNLCIVDCRRRVLSGSCHT